MFCGAEGDKKQKAKKIDLVASTVFPGSGVSTDEVLQVFQRLWPIENRGNVMKKWYKIKLNQKEREAVEKAAEIIKKQFPIDQVILFGSKARGTSDQYSDIDLLLIGAKLLHWREEKAIVEILFQVGQEYGVIFSPLFTSSSEWEGEIFKQFPIYHEILKDGAFVT